MARPNLSLWLDRATSSSEGLSLEWQEAHATGKTKQLFERVQNKLGGVPDLFRVLGTAPAALEGYLNFSGALAGGNLNAKVRDQIALGVAEGNLFGYCLSADTSIGGNSVSRRKTSRMRGMPALRRRRPTRIFHACG